MQNYVELKTTWLGDANFVRYYLQSYLVGVSKLVIGHRDNDEEVLVIERTNLNQVLQLAKSRERQIKRSRFDPYVCLARARGILDALLKHFRSTEQSVKDDDEFELKIDERQNATITRVADLLAALAPAGASQTATQNPTPQDRNA